MTLLLLGCCTPSQQSYGSGVGSSRVSMVECGEGSPPVLVFLTWYEVPCQLLVA